MRVKAVPFTGGYGKCVNYRELMASGRNPEITNLRTTDEDDYTPHYVNLEDQECPPPIANVKHFNMCHYEL